MQNYRALNPTLAVVCVTGLLLAMSTRAATPPSTAEPTVRQLQEQVDALSQELAQLKSAPDPAARQQAMQQHWSMMQNHMGTMRMMPGMGAKGCSDWTMMGPNMMGPGMRQGGSSSCGGWMGHGMMGPGMMAGGMMGPGMMGWGMPSSMTPDVYQSQMQSHMQRMHKQMAAIAAESDPAKRQALIREHYEGMYRDMQTMRGMGWMWAPNAAASLPEAKSQGALLVATYCSQCHATPSPSIHTQTEWTQVTSRMREHIDQQANGAGPDVKVPNASELAEITEYLGKHAAGVR